MFDSHCHLDFAAYDADREAVLERARAAGVRRILVPGVDRAQWAALPSLSSSIPLRFAVGIHPQCVDEGGAGETARALSALEAAIDRASAVAVGELGWDKKSSPASLARQTEVVHAQLAIAEARALPILVHAVGAHGVALTELRRRAPFARGGVMHSYSGSADLVREFVALGLSIAIGPSITLPNARRPIEAARAVPLEHLLVETDGPFQFPHGRASRRGEPADLEEVLRALARIRGEPLGELERATAANAERLFG